MKFKHHYNELDYRVEVGDEWYYIDPNKVEELRAKEIPVEEKEKEIESLVAEGKLKKIES